MSLREEIQEYLLRHYNIEEYGTNDAIEDIISVFEKRIDKVEKDYKNALTPYLKKQPMKEVYPKEMDALNRVRKELV